MKIIAFYLPQFHSIPENDNWWGKGFTEWTNLKKASPLFSNHNQPRIPLHNNYYNLLDSNTMLWQVELAKKYGIYGFCMYHYWFNGHLLLQKPLEQYRDNPNLDIHYCISWANESWTNSWVSETSEILIKQSYGSAAEWQEHFYYLLPYFKDKRYIKIDGKPLFVIYRPEQILPLDAMLTLWSKLAQQNDLPGIVFASQQIDFDIDGATGKKHFTYQIEYQPDYAKRILNTPRIITNAKKNLLVRDYETAWKEIVNAFPINSKSLPGAFVDWDNTPRRHRSGSLFSNVTPELFRKYMTIQVARARSVYHSDFLFLFAWNEWGEGGYLEPDTRWEYGYLEAVKHALQECNELEEGVFDYGS